MDLFKLGRRRKCLWKAHRGEILACCAGFLFLLGSLQASAEDIKGTLHNFHIEEQGMRCKQCHIAGRLPQEATCAECHEAAEAGKLLSTFSIDVARHGPPQPPDHVQDFRRAHGAAAEMDSEGCALCHKQRFCQDCHEGQNLDGHIHPLNFRDLHAFEAQGHDQDCLVCHETRDFCVDCHRRNMVLSHPLGTAWANANGGDHTEEAQANFESCLDCHDLGRDDPVCTRPGCHGSGAGGGE